jgi:hypothetical protein
MTVQSRTASIGRAAPDFALTDQHGAEFRLLDAVGADAVGAGAVSAGPVSAGPVVLVFLRGFG